MTIRRPRAEDMKKEDIVAMEEEEIMAMEDEEIMAMDPEEVYAEEMPGEADQAAATEDVAAVVDQRQMLVDELTELTSRIAEINGLIAQMDAAAVATVDEAMNPPAVTEGSGEPDPIQAEEEMTEEEVVQARRKAMIRAAKRAKTRRRAA